MNKPDRKAAQLVATAYHEAGHAVAAYFLDLPFQEVHIVAAKDSLGKLEQEPVCFDLYPREQAILDELEKRVIKAFAGIVAEARHTGRLNWKYGIDDFDQAFDLAICRHSEGSLDEVDAFLKYTWVRTGEFVRHPFHWTAVVATAKALISRRRLTREEVDLVIGDAIRPLYRESGQPRSEVERLNRIHNGGRSTDTTFTRWLMRRGLRFRRGQPLRFH